MNYNHLKYFQVLFLLISQLSLSLAIQVLEGELNVPLFEKEGRNIKLTKYWEIFLKYVHKSLN